MSNIEILLLLLAGLVLQVEGDAVSQSIDIAMSVVLLMLTLIVLAAFIMNAVLTGRRALRDFARRSVMLKELGLKEQDLTSEPGTPASKTAATPTAANAVSATSPAAVAKPRAESAGIDIEDGATVLEQPLTCPLQLQPVASVWRTSTRMLSLQPWPRQSERSPEAARAARGALGLKHLKALAPK